MVFELMNHQTEAMRKLASGKVLVGGVGSGKSITALAYYAAKSKTSKIVVITTAKKRNSGEWFGDAMKMSLRNDMVVDSWNNIANYEKESDCFFIFDEQKLVGKGAWAKSFQKIAKRNEWILLTATPADTYIDMAQVWIANGFYENITEFNTLHVRFSRFAKYPKIEGYYDTYILDRLGRQVLVEMPMDRHTIRHQHIIDVSFDRNVEIELYVQRWNSKEQKPVGDAGELMRLMRIEANSHWSRQSAIKSLIKQTPRLIIFYNHNYELEILRDISSQSGKQTSEWNGHKHEQVPVGGEWVYLVQYQAGAEGWNCVTTDSVAFYSLPYSYRMFEQAMGRIDRMNTTYTDLNYYVLKSQAIIDKGIWKALSRKKNFQAARFAKTLSEKNIH